MKNDRAGRTSRGKSVAVVKLVSGATILLTVAGLNMGCPETCTNGCLFAADGDCDDGGSGSVSALCGNGTDCFDCGPRKAKIYDFLPPPLDAEQAGRSEISELPPVGQIDE
jgi:hypothetical protein